MRPHLLAIVILATAMPVFGASAQSQTCMDLRKPDAKATVFGELTVQIFAGPPNYGNIVKGDAEEKALVLELPHRICATDGEFIDGTTQFDRVHVSSNIPALLDVLNAAVGRQVTVRGEGFGAHTAHHRAPLVIFVDEVTVR